MYHSTACLILSLLPVLYSFALGQIMAPPNILVFLMDDMGIGDSRVYNKKSKVSMPNLEKLAAAGMTFTDAHAPAAVCAPTRYSVMTGNYPWRGRNPNGTWLFNMPSQVLSGQKTVGQLMKKVGYHTAFLGKVHLGGKVFSKSTGKPKLSMKGGFKDFDFGRKVENTPASLGFDYAYELPQGIQGSPYIAIENGILVGDSTKLREWKTGSYGDSVIEADGFGSPDWDSSMAGPVLTQKALSFLKRHSENNQEKGIRKPFFMYYWSQSCHVPHTPPDELMGEKVKGASLDAHLDMLVEADISLGKIMEALKANGELENTLIIFTSDNGGLSRGPIGKSRAGHNSNEGLRGSKAQIYEGGHRVPLIISWGYGNKNSPIRNGSRNSALIGLQDFFATFAELTNQSMDTGDGLDSQSFFKILIGDQNTSLRDTLLGQANNSNTFGQMSKKMIRENSWKLITNKDLAPLELYNLATDLLEQNNRIDEREQQDRVKRMHHSIKNIFESKRSTKPYVAGNDSKNSTPNQIHQKELFAARANLLCEIKSTSGVKIQDWNQKWKVSGKSPIKISLLPKASTKWNISNFKLVGIPIQNWENGVTTIEGRLNNENLTSWSHHAVGFGVAPQWEKVVVGFPFPTIENAYKGPQIFRSQLGKPNGHRLHWRKFYPEDLREITLEFRSSSGKIDLLLHSPFLAWQQDELIDRKLHDLPYLDELGQVRALIWPGKARNSTSARKVVHRENVEASNSASKVRMGKFGGWIDGPQMEATGRFRTKKVDGKWWLIDPEGYLFFSIGTCMTGWKSETYAGPERANGNFFSYLPGEDDYLRWTGIQKIGGQKFVNYPSLNFRRFFGENWQDTVRKGIHDRMRSWGVNTLGCWSDQSLQRDRKTPYVLISSIWWQASGHRKFPSPFRENFQADIEDNIKKLSWAKNDPYCLGIFLGNELEWPDRIGQKIMDLPSEHPTKQWAMKELRQLDIDSDTPSVKELDQLYLPFVQTFFQKCKAAINKELPNTLFLGCRTHRGPSILGRGAIGYVDVFSVNVYDSRVRSWQVPADADIPILAGEFHFGAVDRGVPSPGLSGSWDQRQRGFSFAHYLASALAEPRFVGVHWFQWIDQSASGRKDRENHQCGFIDVTGKAYPEFTKIVSKVTKKIYKTRSLNDSSTEKILDELIN